MKILIIGGGGREHALAWKAAHSPDVDVIYVAPGNAGTASEPKVQNIAIDHNDIPALLSFAKEHEVDLTIVGPEEVLAHGIQDDFTAAGLRLFGPSREAAALEGSKSFAKEFMARHGIPTAHYGIFTDPNKAYEFIEEHSAPLVIKADGLAAGKGVIIAQYQDEARQAARELLSGSYCGAAGHRIVIEEFLVGEEASLIVVASGETVLPLASAQDHKARDVGDQGPNTGGMGAYSPAPVVSAQVMDKIMGRIIRPTLAGLAKDRISYTGFLYAGLMIDARGDPKVLEYNCRLGDPETQVLLMRMRSSLVALCDAALDGRLDEFKIDWDPRAALGVVLASNGYPGSYAKGIQITGLAGSGDPHVKIFHAGTAKEGDNVVTSGGRVLCVSALGSDVSEARDQVYSRIRGIGSTGLFYRNDIGHRAIRR